MTLNERTLERFSNRNRILSLEKWVRLLSRKTSPTIWKLISQEKGRTTAPSFIAGVEDSGYRGYRSHVIETITAKATELSFVVLNGFTGSGKTLLLKELENTGHQVLDLEGIASHKGSVFGGDPVAPQPAQKRFESVIYDFLARFDPMRPVWIEAESAKIGRLNLPNPLWQKMKLSPVIEIVSPLEARAAYLTADYQEWLGDSARVSRTIDRLKEFQARRTLEEWKGMSERGEWEALATRLLKEHYDRRYSVAGSGHFQSPSAIEGLRDHRPDTVRQCALALSEKALDLFARVPDTELKAWPFISIPMPLPKCIPASLRR